MSKSCNYVFSIVKEEVFASILNSEYNPKWLEKLASERRNFSWRGSKFVYLSWGEQPEETFVTAKKLQDEVGVLHIELYCGVHWQQANYGQEPAPTFASKCWVEDHERSAMLRALPQLI